MAYRSNRGVALWIAHLFNELSPARRDELAGKIEAELERVEVEARVRAED